MKGSDGGPGGMRYFVIVSLMRTMTGIRRMPESEYHEKRAERRDIVKCWQQGDTRAWRRVTSNMLSSTPRSEIKLLARRER